MATPCRVNVVAADGRVAYRDRLQVERELTHETFHQFVERVHWDAYLQDPEHTMLPMAHQRAIAQGSKLLRAGDGDG